MSSRARKVVGYVRVSTRKQEESGISIDGQTDLLRDYARRRKLDLVGIYDDAASGYSRGSASRGGLVSAISRARADGIPILVVSIDRLSRSPAVLKLLDVPGLKILSVKEGRVGKERLRTLVKAAETQSAEIARRSTKAAANRKAQGRTSGNATNLQAGQRRGAVQNMQRSAQKVRDLADVVLARPELRSFSWAERAAALNDAGHLNLISEKKNERKEWTKSSLRKPFGAALEELQFQADLEKDDPGPLMAGTDQVDDDDYLVQLDSLQAIPAASEEPSGLSVAVADAAPQSGDVPEDKLIPPVPNPKYPFPLQRRSLTRTEIDILETIMQVRGWNMSQVTEVLGLPGLDAPLWRAIREGTSVHPEMLSRLLRLFAANRTIWQRSTLAQQS